METHKSFDNKIVPYIDGSLSPEEVSEFEAYMMTHPEFERKIKHQQNEINYIKDLIPKVKLSESSLKDLEKEVLDSIFTLFRPKPANFWESIKLRWEDWFSR